MDTHQKRLNWRNIKVIVPSRPLSRLAGKPLWAWVLCLQLGMLTGCQRSQNDAVHDFVAHDEAHLRARLENKSVDRAAREWFYPKRIDDYFPGMDVVSQPESSPHYVPDQLLDTRVPTTNTPNRKRAASKLAVGTKSKSERAQASENASDAESKATSQLSPVSDEEELRPITKVELPELDKNHILGRNTWMLWCAGNEGFWDWLATDNFGFIDFLKLVDTDRRGRRFAETGLINEPGMEQGTTPIEGEFGLRLDAPQDERIRQWRQAYLKQTFAKLAQGTHKSQRGLKRKGTRSEVLLYKGSPASEAGPDEVGYGPPSAYLHFDDGYGRDDSQAEYQADNTGADAYESAQTDDAKFYDETIPPPDIYGLSSGVIGLRLFPNPYFDEEAQKKWDSKRYYDDREYFTDPSLVRPFRVGMSCAFCHASFHPLKPPKDITRPEWANISGNIGAQYLSMRATVGNLLTPDQFAYHLLESQPRGTIDTSLIASDNINNPNAMNAVFNLPQRELVAFRNPPEVASRTSAQLPNLWQNPAAAGGEQPDRLSAEDSQAGGALATYEQWKEVFANQGLGSKLEHSNRTLRYTPRVLLDGADSVGPWAALSRVYLNIGSYWERWNQVHQPVLGLTPQKPFSIEDCQANSVYWNATNLRVGALRDYFLKITPPMPLLSTEGAQKRLEPIDEKVLKEQAGDSRTRFELLLSKEKAQRIDLSKLERGRQVFAQNCIVCHSSIQPESSAAHLFADDEAGMAEYLKKFAILIQDRIAFREGSARHGEFWEHDPGQWLRRSDYETWASEIVSKPEFWQWNYLSSDYRIPITFVKTNSARALATNAMQGHVWEDFASLSYQRLPSPGSIEYFNPYAGEQGGVERFAPRHRPAEGVPAGGGGPGYYRVPSLISIWATAPFLHNNSLGLYNNDPSVNGRLEAFDDAIHKLLYPERRLLSSAYNGATPERLAADHGLIWRTTEDSYLVVDAKRVPFLARRFSLVSGLLDYFPWLDQVAPLWFPGLILFVGSLIILSLSRYGSRRSAGILFLGLAALLLLALWLANAFPDFRWLDKVRAIRPAMLPVIVLISVGCVLLLRLSRKWTRYAGYTTLVIGLLGSGLIYFAAGQLGGLRIGPIPKGTPVNLIANVNSEADIKVLKHAVKTSIAGFAEIESRHLDEEATKKVMHSKIAPALMEINKCPDFIMDRGHYFQWFHSMADEDKEALIELLKTF